MKQSKIYLTQIVLAILLISSDTLFAQSIPEPEYSGRPYTLAPNNTLNDLERTDAQVDIKVKALGYGGYESYYTAFSAKSEIRLNKNNLPKFIIKIDANTDPSELISMAKAKIKKIGEDSYKALQPPN
jgi:hypothetical protein